MREREKKYVAIYLLCTANSRKMRIDENKLLARTETNSILGMTMLMTMIETIQSLASLANVEREKKKLIVFIVSSNLLMDKIGASKENQIKKVVVQVLSFHRRMFFFLSSVDVDHQIKDSANMLHYLGDRPTLFCSRSPCVISIRNSIFFFFFSFRPCSRIHHNFI